MQVTVNVGESLASIDTDTDPSVEEIETLARICLEYALRAHACHSDFQATRDE